MTYTVRVNNGGGSGNTGGDTNANGNVNANGRLSLRWGREMSLTLEAVGGDHFVDGIYTVTFTRGTSGEVNGLTISTRRIRRLRAERETS